MAYQRLQPTRAIQIIPTDDLLLPGGPGSRLAFGETTAVLADSLQDDVASVDFRTIIKAGDTVYNLSTGSGARVIGVPETRVLTLSDDIFTAVGDIYIVGSVVKGSGAALWIGTGGSISGKTAGGDDIVLDNIPDGSLLPILMSVINEAGTTATGIYGLW